MKRPVRPDPAKWTDAAFNKLYEQDARRAGRTTYMPIAPGISEVLLEMANEEYAKQLVEYQLWKARRKS